MHIQDYLSEGISFFKDSKRLKSIADKIEKTSKYSSAEVSIVISKLRGIAAIFEKIENAYKTAKTAEDKEKINSDYEAARTKYSSFIKMMNRENFTKALKASLDLGIIGAAVFLGYKNIDNYAQKIETPDIVPNVRTELKVQGIINGALMGATTATAIGFTMLFKKLFSNKGDELYNKTRDALFALEKAEKMKDIKKVEKDIPNG